GNLAVNGAGKVTVAGASTFTGATVVNAGRLLLGADSTGATTGALGANTGALTLNAGVLDLNGFSLTKGLVSGNAGFQVINNGAAPATLTLGVGNVSGTLAADLNDGVSSLALRKVGTGTLTVQGNSFYTGGVTIEAGRVLAGSGTAFGQGATITVLAGGSFDLNGQSLGIVDSAARGLNLVLAGAGDGTNAALVNTNAAVPNAGAGFLNLTLAANASFGGSGGRFDIGRVEGSEAYGTITSAAGQTYTLTKVGSNQVNLRGRVSNLNLAVTAGTVGFEDSDVAASTSATVSSGATLATYGNRLAGTAFTLLNGGTLGNLGGGTGTWTGAGVLGSLATDTVNITSTNGSVIVNGALSGPAKLNLNGTANFVQLGGDNNALTGEVIVASSGSLGINHNNALGAGALTLTGAATLDNFSGAPVVVGGGTLVNFNNSFTYGGTGSLDFGARNFTGTAARTITLNGTQTLRLGGAVNLGANTLTIAGGTANSAAYGANVVNPARGARLVLGGANTLGALTMGSDNNLLGTVRLENALALGAVGSALILSNAGANQAVAVLELGNNVTIDDAKTLRITGRSYVSGSNYANFGDQVALRSADGANSWLGNVSIYAAGGGYAVEALAGSTLTIGDVGTAKTIQNDVTTSTRALFVRGAGDVVINSKVTNNGTGVTGLTMVGTGTLTIARGDNDFGSSALNPALLGGTTVITTVAPSGAASSLGAGTTIGLGATLRYVGGGATSTDRALQFYKSTATLDSSGAGSVTFGGTAALSYVALSATGVYMARAPQGVSTVVLDGVENMIVGS
ncbi:hypothetical protein EBR16_04900, partial [bacterium]|nr:hypothetical protein [bacterium]